MVRNIVRYLLRESGLLSCPPFYRDGQFYLAALAGMLVFAGIYLFTPVQAPVITPRQVGVYFMLIFWQPFWALSPLA